MTVSNQFGGGQFGGLGHTWLPIGFWTLGRTPWIENPRAVKESPNAKMLCVAAVFDTVAALDSCWPIGLPLLG